MKNDALAEFRKAAEDAQAAVRKLMDALQANTQATGPGREPEKFLRVTFEVDVEPGATWEQLFEYLRYTGAPANLAIPVDKRWAFNGVEESSLGDGLEENMIRNRVTIEELLK